MSPLEGRCSFLGARPSALGSSLSWVYSAHTSSLWDRETGWEAGAAGCWVAPGRRESAPRAGSQQACFHLDGRGQSPGGHALRCHFQVQRSPFLPAPSPAGPADKTPAPFLRGLRHRKSTSTPITLLAKRPPTQTPACPSPQRGGRLRIGLDPETPGGFGWISHLTFSRLLRHRPPDHLPPEGGAGGERKRLQSLQGWGVDWRSGLLGRGKRAFPPGVLAQ